MSNPNVGGSTLASPIPPATIPLATMTASGRPLTNRWLALSLLVLVAILNYADRYLLPGLAQPIKNYFALSDIMMGLLMGPAFALLYTVGSAYHQLAVWLNGERITPFMLI